MCGIAGNVCVQTVQITHSRAQLLVHSHNSATIPITASGTLS